MLLKVFRDFLEFELLELEISDALDETATETELLIASLVALDLFMSKLSSLSRCRVNWKLIKARHLRARCLRRFSRAQFNDPVKSMIDTRDTENCSIEGKSYRRVKVSV